MTNRLAGIAEFVAVVQTGSFAAAGERLGLSRSAVGKTIARLEARVGARLCRRTTRSFSLTEDGDAFYERCLRILAEADAAEAALDSGRREPAGRVRISVPVLFGRWCVAPVLLELAERHPRLEFDVSFTDRPVDLVEESFDLAVRNATVVKGGGLMTRKLASQRMTVCAAPGYLDARGRPRSLEDLEQHDAVVYGSSRDGVEPWSFPNGRGGTTAVPMKSRLRLDDLEAIADAAARGVGLAWLPSWLVAERLRSGKLVRILENVEVQVFDTCALWLEAPNLPSRMRVLLDALAARLPAMTG